jgi:LmbE family N-acetylglucosaminyl deacetylase
LADLVSGPHTPEQTWIDFLGDIPDWTPEEKPTVVVAPHPDDETLGAGGLIATQRFRRIPVTLLAVTDGEAAYENVPDLAEKRQMEQLHAAAALGLMPDSVHRLALPDSAVAEFETRLEDYIEANINSGALLVAPWPRDPHPDHEACGRAAAKAADRTGAALIFYFFWTWHRFSPEGLKGLSLRRLTLSAEARSGRARALACHRSQLYRDEGEPILPDIFLSPARRTFETYVIHGDQHGI